MTWHLHGAAAPTRDDKNPLRVPQQWHVGTRGQASSHYTAVHKEQTTNPIAIRFRAVRVPIGTRAAAIVCVQRCVQGVTSLHNRTSRFVLRYQRALQRGPPRKRIPSLLRVIGVSFGDCVEASDVNLPPRPSASILSCRVRC